MRTRRLLIAVIVTLGAAAAAAGCFALGRGSAHAGAARAQGYASGQAAGYAGGLRDGRATQATLTLPPDQQQALRDAFTGGYAAGANDVFVGYDGGWGLSEPYVIVLVHGDNGITYRIASRTPLQPGIDYHLCPDKRTLCQESRR